MSWFGLVKSHVAVYSITHKLRKIIFCLNSGAMASNLLSFVSNLFKSLSKSTPSTLILIAVSDKSRISQTNAERLTGRSFRSCF